MRPPIPARTVTVFPNPSETISLSTNVPEVFSTVNVNTSMPKLIVVRIP